MARKVFRIIFTVLLVITALLFTLYSSLLVTREIIYKDAFSLREYVCDVADINSGFVPQGLCYVAEKDVYLQSGYNDANETLLYVTENGSSRRVELKGTDGNTLKGHAGGVDCYRNYMYVANGSKLDIFKLDEVLNADGNAVTSVGTKPVVNAASYVFCDGTYINVGEFYRAGNYETEEAHHYATPNGDENKAIISRYKLNADGSIDGDYPEYCISVTGLVQGFAVKGATFILSRSYGLADSHLEYYAAPARDGETTVTVWFTKDGSGKQAVPLYYLDSSKLLKSLNLPSFSEDLTIVGNRVAVQTEAACNKYIIGKLFGADKVYSYPLDI